MQAIICENVGITGWEDQLISAIKDVVRLNGRRARILSLVYISTSFLPPLQVSLPAPSSMIWADAKKILITEDFGDESELKRDLPPVEEVEEVRKELKKVVKEVDEIFEYIRDGCLC